MSWKDLLEKPETVDLPWVGGRDLRQGPRRWSIRGRLPPEHGWYQWRLDGREARVTGARVPIGVDPKPDKLGWRQIGYLVGDRIVPDGARVNPDPKEIVKYSEPVYLIDDGLDRFARISAGRICEDGPLVFIQQEFPLGPEDDVLSTFLDRETSVEGIKNVSPALDAAFRLEVFQWQEAERRRRELEEQRRREEEERQKAERRRQLAERLGDGESRREMAKLDFDEAARAALAVGGAAFLDSRGAPNRRERIVRYRVDGQRYECVCDKETLQIVDAGICLVDHGTGERGDTYFTLESLPGVVRQAMNGGVLHRFRHVGR